MLRLTTNLVPFFEGATASAVSTMVLNVTSYAHITLSLGATGGAVVGTFKVAGSIGPSKFDASVAKSAATNRWDYVEFYNYEDSSNRYDGDTGWVLAAADHQNVTVNTNGLDWLTVVIAGVTDGAFYAYGKGFNNE